MADVPERLRASFNPLAGINTESRTGREDLEVIADGLVKRSDPRHEEWYEGAVSIHAGIMAYALETAPPEFHTLTGLRSVLVQGNVDLYEDAKSMQGCTAFGGLARAAGVTIQTAIDADKGMEKDFLAAARRSTEWLDSPPIAEALGASTFALSDLKHGKASVFVVLPPQYLERRAAFLRLIVRTAINAMMVDGVKAKGECLMLLDEFYSLGRLDIVAVSAGLMPGYGLHLWPFLQDLNQLRHIYKDVSETFFANSDATTFFGNTDLPTLEYVSRRIGGVRAEDIGPAPVMGSGVNPITGATVGAVFGASRDSTTRATGAVIGGLVGGLGSAIHDLETRAKQKDMAVYQQKAMGVGHARLAPEQVQEMTGKEEGAKVARGLLAFLKSGQVLYLRPAPYFEPNDPPAAPIQSAVKPTTTLTSVIYRFTLFSGVIYSIFSLTNTTAFVPNLIAIAVIVVGIPLFIIEYRRNKGRQPLG